MPAETLLSANQRNQLHWARRHKLAKRIHHDMFCLAFTGRTHTPPNAPLQRARVIIQSRRARLLDEDNLIAGAKPYIDALCKIGVIIDDRPENVQLKVVQVKSNKASRGVVIRVTEMQSG